MGGAFIAVADDATAASWNSGGLTQLEKAVNVLRLLAGCDDNLSPPCAAAVGLDWAIHVLKQIAK